MLVEEGRRYVMVCLLLLVFGFRTKTGGDLRMLPTIA